LSDEPFEIKPSDNWTDDKWYMKAGCHNISMIEIEDFIERYKLDW